LSFLPPNDGAQRFSWQFTEKDVPVLAPAIRGGADFLITGDKRHFGKIKLPAPYSLKIAIPSEFIDFFLPVSSSMFEGGNKMEGRSSFCYSHAKQKGVPKFPFSSDSDARTGIGGPFSWRRYGGLK